MNTNENEVQLEKEQERVLPKTTGIVTPVQDSINFSEEEKENSKSVSREIVDEMLQADFVDEKKVLKNFSQFGKTAEASSDKTLMKNKTLAQLAGNDVKNNLAEKLIELKRTTSAITDNANVDASFLDKIKRKFMKNKQASNFVMKRQEAETVISGIIEDLYKSRDVLERDNIQLENFQNAARIEMRALQQQINFGEDLYQELLRRNEAQEFANKPRVFEEAVEKTLVRTKLLGDKLLQLFQAAEAADSIYKNNEKLTSNIEEYSKAAESMMYVSIFIADSLSSQKAALKGVEEVKTFINDLMLSNSQMLAENTADVNKFMSTGILDIETAKKSLAILSKTVEEQEQSTKRIIEESRKHIDEMNGLMSGLKNKYIPDEDVPTSSNATTDSATPESTNKHKDSGFF